VAVAAAIPCPPPLNAAIAAEGELAVRHVVQPIVPVVVIVPPVMGEVVAMLVTPPEAAAAE